MRRPQGRKKAAAAILAAMAVGALLYAAAAWSIRAGLHQIVLAARRDLSAAGVNFTQFSFAKAVLSMRGRITLHQVSARIEFADNGVLGDISAAGMNAETLAVIVPGFSFPRTLVQAEKFRITFARKGEYGPGSPLRSTKRNTIEGSTFSALTPLDPFRPRDSLSKAAEELITFCKTGAASTHLDFEGRSYMVTGKGLYTLHLRTVRDGAQSRLVVNADDLRELIRQSEEQLTRAEVQILADYPYRALRLLEIKEQASSKSRAAVKSDTTVPEDAYRHVLWSYLLAREFGPKFARLVADAHEEGETDEKSSQADHEMDLANNEVGRRFAAQGVEESDILRRVRQDMRVVRSPGKSGHKPQG